MFRKHWHKTNGFTLMEIVIVTAILGLLAAIVLPTLIGNLHKAQGSKEKQILEQAVSVADDHFQRYSTFTGFGDDTAPADNVPDWPASQAAELSWKNFAVWDPVNNASDRDKVVAVEEITAPNPDAGEQLNYYMYGNNDVYYCVKILNDAATYGTSSTSAAACISNATADAFPSTP